MAYDGWIEFADTELVNLSRTAQLAQVLGIDTVWFTPGSVQWIEDALMGSDYSVISTAPWYDADVPASSEFAGIVPLSFAGIDDSSRTSTVMEYINDGGNGGRARNATLPIVANVALIASTDRGAEYGLRWMNRLLRDSDSTTFCSGARLEYFRYSEGEEKAHRRNVRLTRGSNVTRKWTTSCSSTWLATFTLTAADPYEYGAAEPVVEGLGGDLPTGPALLEWGFTALTEDVCPQYDYTPIYDPLFPALVPPPAVPDFYPDGWGIELGMTFSRSWARVSAPGAAGMGVVPVISLSSSVEARMIRVSVWGDGAEPEDQCDPLFSTVVTYLPAFVEFTIDAEQQASYVWDGVSPVVRRADSLVFGPDAHPIDWAKMISGQGEFLITLDQFGESGGSDGSFADVEVTVSFVSKSD